MKVTKKQNPRNITDANENYCNDNLLLIASKYLLLLYLWKFMI